MKEFILVVALSLTACAHVPAVADDAAYCSDLKERAAGWRAVAAVSLALGGSSAITAPPLELEPRWALGLSAAALTAIAAGAHSMSSDLSERYASECEVYELTDTSSPEE